MNNKIVSVLVLCFCFIEGFTASLNDIINIYTPNSRKAKMVKRRSRNENYRKSFLSSISFGLAAS